MSGHGQQIPAIYQTAIRKYEQITDKKLDDPALLGLDSVDGLKHEIEARNRQFTEFRPRSHAFFETLEVAMKPIELIRSIASDAAGVAFAPSSLLFGAVSYLVSAANGVSTSYNAIREPLDTLKLNTSIVEDRKAILISRRLLQSGCMFTFKSIYRQS